MATQLQLLCRSLIADLSGELRTRIGIDRFQAVERPKQQAAYRHCRFISQSQLFDINHDVEMIKFASAKHIQAVIDRCSDMIEKGLSDGGIFVGLIDTELSVVKLRMYAWVERLEFYVDSDT